MTTVARFKEADLVRAVRGVEKAGLVVGRIEIDVTGKIIILPGDATAPASTRNEWDDELR